MGQSKYIKKKEDAHEILLEQTQELSLIDEEMAEAFDDSWPVYVVEYPHWHPIKIAYDGTKIHMRKVYEDDDVDKEKLLSDFKEGYVRGFSKIIREFEGLPFVMFGDYVPEQPNYAFMIFDIFVNGNWISHPDLVRIVADNNFTHPRVLFHGLFNEDVIRKVITSVPSSVNEKENIKYCFVKPEMESLLSGRYSRRVGGIVSDQLIKKKEKEKGREIKEAKRKAASFVAEYLSFVVDSDIFTEWQSRVLKEGLQPKEENKGLILSFLVEESLNDVQVDIHQMSEQHNIDIDIIEDTIKKQLPKYIMKAFEFV